MYDRSWRRRTPLVAGLLIALALQTNATTPALHAAGTPNARVSHDRYPVHAEPSIALNPRNPRNLLGASMLMQVPNTLLAAYASFDGGTTWHDYGALPLPAGT